MRTSPPPHAPANRTDGVRHRPRALTVFAAAFIAGAAAAVGVNRVLDVRLAQLKPRVESESIFVALRSLPQGSPVTVWDVALRDWPKAMLPGTALRAQDSFAGMVLKHPLREGQPLLSVQLTPAETGRGPGDPTAAAPAPSFVQLQTPAAPATADLWTPAEPARPQPPAPQPTPVAVAPEAERPAKPSDTGTVMTPVAGPSVAGPTTPATEPAGDPIAPPAADPARIPTTAGANDAAVSPQPIVAPESRPQTVGPEPQSASLPTTATEPRPDPAPAAPAPPAPTADQASAQPAPSTQSARPDAGPMPVDEASPADAAPQESPNAGGLAAKTTPATVTDDLATASAPLPQQAAVTPTVEPVTPRQTVETQQPIVAQQPVVTSAGPDVEPATVANEQPAQAAGPTVMVAEGRPTPADPDVTAPASQPQPAVVESVVAPPATASLPPAPASQRADAAAPRPAYPRYLVVPEKIALQADRSFAAPAPADPQPSTPTPSQTTAAKQPQEPGDTAAVRPLPSTASAGSGSARGQASPQGNPATRQSRQPAPPRRGSTPPAETKPRIGATMFPNLSNGTQSLEGRTQRQPSGSGSSTQQR